MDEEKIDPPDLAAFDGMSSHDANIRFRQWLEDDDLRAKLYGLVNAQKNGELTFQSRDTWHRDCNGAPPDAYRPSVAVGYKAATLVTSRKRIEEVLSDRTGKYSSRIYAELGGGSFMLALDPWAEPAHGVQRAVYDKCFDYNEHMLRKMSYAACDAASIMAFRATDFDLAAFAEQAAVRFCEKLMGYAFSDYALLESRLRVAYRGLVYQVLGRHIATDPLALPAAKEAMGRLVTRTSELLTAYAVNDKDGLKGCEDPTAYGRDASVLQRLAKLNCELNGEQRAVLAVGAMTGVVGNVQAAACIATKAILGSDDLSAEVRELVGKDDREQESDYYERWRKLLAAPLRANPPIPILPRIDMHEKKDILLALGGGTAREVSAQEGSAQEDRLVWGRSEGAQHGCAGFALGWPLIVEIVRAVMRLPAVAEKLDARDATPIGLTKTWGFACDSYPLTYRRDHRLHQTTLNVVMRLRSPVRESADRVREVIRSGAPEIEKLLRESRHVHFAWFELIDNDASLVLHTVYDGPFSPYVHHFALKAGDLFDSLFKWIENPPPMPVKDFPNEFVAHIQQYDRPPMAGYLYSAYPTQEAAAILRNARVPR